MEEHLFENCVYFQVSLKAIRYEVSPDREYALFAFDVEPVSKQIWF